MDLQRLAQAKATFDAMAAAMASQMESDVPIVDANAVARQNAEGAVPLIQASQMMADALEDALTELDARVSALESPGG